jgi:hypothetical protein
MRYEKLSRSGGLALAAVVATLTFAVVAHAVQAITTPNAATVAYSLAQGTSSAGITPVVNKPVFVMGDQMVAGNVGSSDMTIVNSNPGDGNLDWNGIESNGGGTTTGASATTGTHIIFIDHFHCVDLEVNSATSFRVTNPFNEFCFLGTQKGNVTLIW